MPATNEVDVCNLALGMLGAKPITALTEGTKRAILCSAFYEQTRDEVQAAHPWNCCTSRQKLNKDSAAPAFGFDNSFQLPTNPYCLRVLNTDDDRDVFVIEGRKLLTDETTISIRFIARVSSVVEWPPLLVKAVAAKLAMELTHSITELTHLSELMAKRYEMALAEARTIDSQEGTPMSTDIDVLVAARRGDDAFDFRAIKPV